MRNMFVGTCKNYYYYFGKSILGDPGAVSWVRKNGGESFLERAREPYGMLLLTNQFHGLFEGLIALVCDLAQKK